MKIKSVSGLTLYVEDLNKTVKFYETLGFVTKKREVNHATVYINWFFMDFILVKSEDKPKFKEEAISKNKGAGMYVYISVDDVDSFYKDAVKVGLRPSSEPRDWPWGNREFVIRDPDGYKLVFFRRK